MKDVHAILNDPITTTVGIVLGLVFIMCISIEFVLSKWLKKDYVSSHYLIINLSIAFLQQLTDVLSKTLFIGAFIYVQTHWSVQQWLGLPSVSSNSTLVTVFNYIAVLLIADFCQYWLHRFSHEVNIMWAGHITHHSNTEYNLSVAVRQNALEGIYTWIFFIPLAFLSIPWQMFVLAYSISLLWQFAVHTRFIGKLGVLEKFMSTPSHHRAHHGKNPQYIDKNYGALLIIWDKLFGTFEEESEEVQYGITTPLANENPAWANIHHHAHIIRTARATSNWRDKWRVVFGTPVFVPRGILVEDTNKEISFTQQGSKKLYVFINFVLTAALGFWLINYAQQLQSVLLFATTALGIVVCFSIYTELLQNKKWADIAEVVRLLLIAVSGLIVAMSSFLYGFLLIAVSACLLLFTFFIADAYNDLETMKA